MVIITGAAGFIGSHLVDRLLADGHRVIGIDNFVRGSRDNIAEALADSRFTLIEADLADPDQVANVVEPMLHDAADAEATVWHLAANSDIAAGVTDPQVDLRDTFLTTVNMLALMRRQGLRKLVFASTSAVYGETDAILAEDFGPLLPISSYGAMKLASEAAISAAAEAYLDQVWLCRFPNVIGGRSTHGVIYDLVGKLLKATNQLEVLGDGTQCKPYLHVAELVDAMIFIRSRAGDKRALYNIGPEDDGANVRYIAEAVIAACGRDVEIHYTGGDRGWVGDVPRVKYSVDKLAGLGWRPASTSEKAVDLAVTQIFKERGVI